MRWTKRTCVGWIPNLLVVLIVLTVAGVARHAGMAAAQAPKPTSQSSPAVANPHGDLRVACEVCHTAESWTSMRTPSAFDHASTGFALEGKHAVAACKDCHGSPVFSRVATSCADCHRDVHEGRFGLRCQDCHTPDRWVERTDAVRRHASTSFPLVGVHAILECTQCHTGTDEAHLTKVSSECVSCHADAYAATQNPNHTAAGYSTQCQDCHDANRGTWTGSGFDHASTGFALTGAHRTVNCNSCHSNGTYAGLSNECVACHRADYDGATNPNHATAGFPTNCIACHGTTSWQGATFDHAQTAFPLTGAHAQVNCTQCHNNGQYTGTPTDCYSCHRSDYEQAANPNHVTAQFPTNCTACHGTTSWQGATFDHSQTAFPLTGAHAQVNCTQCHGNGQYAGTPTDCYACHRANYESTTDPNHVTAGFSTTCTACHGTTSWQGATFDHAQTAFPLTGAHAQVNCTQCHGNGQYAGTPTDCYACHRANYDGTTNPNHAAAGFSTTCTACHGTSTWQGATFDHDSFFRIYSGHHNGRWTSCTQCHQNPASYQDFTCTTCHGQSETDSHHQSVNNYQYESHACYSCHRNS